LKPLDGAHAEGVRIILTARNPERLQRTAKEIDALSTAAFDATDFKLLKRFFDDRSAHLLLRLQIDGGQQLSREADLDCYDVHGA
jgi:hypothetical protein